MKYKIFILMMLTCTTTSLLTNIYEITSMAALKPYLTHTEGLLVVFDIDSTLLKLHSENISVPWFCNELEFLQQQSMQPREKTYKNLLKERQKQLDEEYTQELNTVPVELAEPIISTLMSTLTDNNIHFLIQTKRGFPHIDITHLQLNSVGINQKASSPWNNICYKLTNGLPQPVYYDNGILFTGLHTTKGDALKALLKKISYKPKRLVAVDDQRDNLVSFAKMAQEMEIDFIGLRYGFLDPFTKKAGPEVFDPLNCGLPA